MKNELFNAALKDGKYISINEFESGEGIKCGCTCPKCGEAVVSNVTAKKRSDLKRKFTNHFSHHDEHTNCTGGHGETEIHLFAKQVIEENSSLEVPHFEQKSEQLEYLRAVSEPAFPFERHKQRRPDILLYDISGIKTAIEIIVTNPVSKEKAELYSNAELKCLSIDLNRFYKQELSLIKDEITKAILIDIVGKKWVWTDEESNNVVQDSEGSSNSWIIAISSFLIFLYLKPILRFLKKLFSK